MSNVRLVYFSRAVKDMSLEDIRNILETARSNNSELGVCGMLCYEARWFLQVLEGDREQVSELFIDIADDPRHDEVVIVSYDYVDEPYFKDWKMGYVASGDSFSQALRACDLDTFEPAELSPEASIQLLKAVSQAPDALESNEAA